jgi:hypothetical protein
LLGEGEDFCFVGFVLVTVIVTVGFAVGVAVFVAGIVVTLVFVVAVVVVVVVAVVVIVAVNVGVVAASTRSDWLIRVPDVVSTNFADIFPPGKDGNVTPESVFVRTKPEPVKQA